MVRVHLIVEGQTEEAFVKNVLAPYAAPQNVFIDARSVETGRKGQMRFRGGMTTYAKAKKDILTWLAEDVNAYVSTMFDLYRLPNDFPGFQTCAGQQPRQKVATLETALGADISHSRFVPYLQLHEFESLLFADPNSIDQLVPTKNSQLAALNSILTQFNADPELINERPQLAPSKRILSLYPRYDKVAYGHRVVQKAGVQTVLTNCQHFREWVDRLVALTPLP